MMAIAAVTVLFYFSYKPNVVKNGFTRKMLRINGTYKYRAFDDNSRLTIAGLNNQKIYLFSTDKKTFFVLDEQLATADSFKINASVRSIDLNRYFTIPGYPQTYLLSSSDKKIIKYNLVSQTDSLYNTSFYYSRAVPISKDILAIRKYYRDSLGSDYEMVKYNTANGQISSTKRIFDQHYDGGFSSEGTLLYDALSQRLIYICYFNNHIICLDTNLQILYKAKTIDTNDVAKITIKRFGKGQNLGYTMASPPLVVNKETCINNGKLFVISNMRADNESEKTFRENTIVDTYAISDGAYKGSFYVPDIFKEKAIQFSIQDNLWFFITRHYIGVYKFN